MEQSACNVITAPEPHIVCKSCLGQQRGKSVQVGDSQLCKQCKYHGLVHPVQINDHPVQICIVWYAATNRLLCSPLNLQQLLCALSACCSCTGGRCRNQRLLSCLLSFFKIQEPSSSRLLQLAARAAAALHHYCSLPLQMLICSHLKYLKADQMGGSAGQPLLTTSGCI